MNIKLILKVLLSLSLLLFFLSLIGYKNPISIPGNMEDQYFVLAVAIDRGVEDKNNYRLTAVTEDFTGEDGGPRKGKVSTIEGQSIFDAIREYGLYNKKIMFWGHIKYIIISEEIAKENVLEILDFFTRDHELRLNVTVAIVKDISAESLLRIEDKTGEFILEHINGVFETIDKNSFSKEFTLLDIIKQVSCQDADIYIPMIKLIAREEDVVMGGDEEKKSNGEGSSDEDVEIANSGESKQQGEIKEDEKPEEENGVQDENDSEKKGSTEQGATRVKTTVLDPKSESSAKPKSKFHLVLSGYAIFKEAKMVEYIYDFKARGLNWVNNNIQSGIIVIENDDHKIISMEIMDASSKIKIKLEDGKPEAMIDIKFTTTVAEVMSKNEVFKKGEFEKFIDKQNEIIKKEIEEVTELVQKLGTDVLFISEEVKRQHPLKWDGLKEDWEETFKTMKITVNVESKIRGTYQITETIESISGE